MISTRFPGAIAVAGAVVGTLLSLPLSAAAAPVTSGAPTLASMEDQGSVTSAITAKLNKKQFENVKVTVDNGIATLTGTVDVYDYKADAGKRAQKVKGVSAVRNQIQVGGPNVADAALQSKLVGKLQYDRVGYGDTAFNAISLNVQNGVVTLGGHARTEVDRDSAIALVSFYPGVKDLVQQIQVDPVSIMDDHIRFAVARSVYSYPTLNKYAVDPAKPIRISVQNGNVELYGVVLNQSDKDVAFLRANSVPGVFTVKNYLEVANQPAEGGAKNTVRQN